MGRFITEDPIKDGYNWYAYVGNDPINYIDPLGLAEVWGNATNGEAVIITPNIDIKAETSIVEMVS